MTPSPWNTPQILKTGFTAVCITSLLFMIAAVTGARSHRHAMQVIGRDSGPVIIAAEHIGSALADMDANAANELLDPSSEADARRAFEERRNEATEAIVTAAGNITDRDKERGPILKLATGAGGYVARIQEARDLRAANNPRFLDTYREAAEYMDSTLLRAAADLDQADRVVLDETYSRARIASGLSLAFLILSALMLTASLVALQFFLTARMRRLLNPMLFLATVLTLFLTIYGLQAFVGADRELKVAKQDAFESIHVLWQARSLAYSANADESRSLLDPSHAAVYDASFLSKADRIAAMQPGQTQPTGGFLAAELNNITFVGEREAAAETVARFAEYLDMDRKIRKLEQAKSHAAAVALCLGKDLTPSASSFSRFDRALGQTLDVNERAFSAAVERGFNHVAGFEITLPVASLVIVFLAWLGLRPRLREYED